VGYTTIIKCVLAFKLGHKPLAQVVGPEAHDSRKAVLEHPTAPYVHVALGVGDRASMVDHGNRRLSADSRACIAAHPRRQPKVAEGRPTWSCAL
jgi:hypothetical protein